MYIKGLRRIENWTTYKWIIIGLPGNLIQNSNEVDMRVIRGISYYLIGVSVGFYSNYSVISVVPILFSKSVISLRL